MSYKKLIPFINGENELAANVVTMAEDYCFAGADELFLYNYSKITEEREEFLATLKEIDKKIDIPFIVGMYAARFEDVKKAFYTGADRVVVKYEICPDEGVIKEAAARFGEDKILVEVDEGLPFEKIAFPVSTLLLKHVNTGEPLNRRIKASGKNFLIRDSLLRNDLEDLLKIDEVQGVATNYFERRDLFKVKRNMEEAGIEMNTFKSAIPFSEFKTDDKGLVPCIVQDYRTGQVLMLAYMNEESYQATCETGKMTYFSRSRQKLWVKGETSGHFQYVKSLTIDCDLDTLLAKVDQIGAACHTGNPTCFFQPLVGIDYDETNPLRIFESVYDTIADRKENPKEGSYTNYLFDKGIDKILKKIGEEATEVVIAAKNPNPEEVKYEIADFLYHAMVLMVEKGLTWEDIVKELADR